MKLVARLIALLPFVALSRAQSLRRRTAKKSSSSSDGGGGNWPNPNTPGINYHYKLSESPYDELSGGRLKEFQPDAISNATMALAVLELYPGGVRELHWHPFATEWGYVTAGTCRITLMNNDGQYSNLEANPGDIWNFPTSWGHSIQGVHPEDGCKMALAFNYAPQKPTVDDLGLSGIMTAFAPDELSENLGGVPPSTIKTFLKSSTAVNQGPFPPPPFPESQNPLPSSPLINVFDGECLDAGEGGYVYEVKSDIFPGATTMSGGYMHLDAGTLRDIHWHPNADELQYILNGTVRVTVYGIEGIYNTFEISAGDVGFVPVGYAHTIQAVGGPADFLLAFNSPSWATQELSQWLSVTPSYLIATSVNTTVDVVEDYFPKQLDDFFNSKPSSKNCPDRR